MSEPTNLMQRISNACMIAGFAHTNIVLTFEELSYLLNTIRELEISQFSGLVKSETTEHHTENESNRTYLGDGVFAQLVDNNFRIKLATMDDHDVIYLEPPVFENLVDYGRERFGKKEGE